MAEELTNTDALDNPYGVNQVDANVPPPAKSAPPAGPVNGAMVYPAGQRPEPMPSPRRNIRPFTQQLTPGSRRAKPPANQPHTAYGTDYDAGMLPLGTRSSVAHTTRGNSPDTPPLTWAEAQQVLAHAKTGCQLCRGCVTGINVGMATLRDSQAREQRAATGAALERRSSSYAACMASA
jgi:hypothetical protein